jgi:hypothetical protein
MDGTNTRPRLTRLRRRVGAVVVGLLAAAGITAVTAAPAQASLPYCDAVSVVYDEVGTLIMYETRSRSPYQPDLGCDMYINQSPNAGQQNAITQLQWDLRLCYAQNITVDGLYGNGTRNAVKNVQNALNIYYGAGLVVDGYAGPLTRQAMLHWNAYLNGSGCHWIRTNPVGFLPGMEYTSHNP